MASGDKRWVVAGGAVVLTAGVVAGILALVSRSSANLAWNPLFDACGVAAVLGLGVIVSAMAIDGLADNQPAYTLALGEWNDPDDSTSAGAAFERPTLRVRQLFANQERADAYRTRYELKVETTHEVMCLRVEAHAWSVVRVALTSDGCVEEHGGGDGSGSAWSRLACPPQRLNLDVFTSAPETQIELLASVS